MAHEVTKNESMDFRVDVFSFGIMMWEVMMQERPFKDYFSAMTINYAIANDGKRPEPIPTSPPQTLQSPSNSRASDEMFSRWISLIKRCWDQDFHKRPL